MDFLIFIFIIWWLVSSLARASKAAKKKQSDPKVSFDEARKAQQAASKPEAPKQAAVHRQETAERRPAAAAPRAEMAPRVQTTVAVTPHDHTGMFEGSMDTETGEGEDPHDHGQRPKQAMPSQYSDRIINRRSAEEDEPQAAQPGLDLGWDDRDSLVRAFVMQEVLTRPCDRKR